MVDTLNSRLLSVINHSLINVFHHRSTSQSPCPSRPIFPAQCHRRRRSPREAYITALRAILRSLRSCFHAEQAAAFWRFRWFDCSNRKQRNVKQRLTNEHSLSCRGPEGRFGRIWTCVAFIDVDEWVGKFFSTWDVGNTRGPWIDSKGGFFSIFILFSKFTNCYLDASWFNR